MRAILWHFTAVGPERVLGVEWDLDEQRQYWGNGDVTGRDVLVGARLLVRPLPHADRRDGLGGYRLLNLDDDTDEQLGKRIREQLSTLQENGAPYATIVLSLDPGPGTPTLW